MATKTASRILLSILTLGPWVLSGYYIIAGYVVYGVLLFILGLLFTPVALETVAVVEAPAPRGQQKQIRIESSIHSSFVSVRDE